MFRFVRNRRSTCPEIRTTYAFAVRAENANGQGAATPTLRAVPVHPDAPQRPGQFTAIPGHEGVRLTWSPPHGNHPVTSYQYRLSTDGGTNWSPDWTAITGSDADTTEHTLTNLSNGTTYTFELRALKDSTAGPAARAEATPSLAAAREVQTGGLHVEVGVDALRSESPLPGGASNALRGQASLGW